MESIIKYNDKECIVFLNEENIDLDTLKQIKSIIVDPTVENARLMPDVHKGSGCCVGFTAHLTDKIIPSLIGIDIGCGILSYNIKNKYHRFGDKKLERILRKQIPMGSEKHKKLIVSNDDFKHFLEESQKEALQFSNSYKEKFNKDISMFIPNYSLEWIDILLDKINYSKSDFLNGLGTLGGGNHYVEVNLDSKDDAYLTIHSGSRGFGYALCNYHQNKITNCNKFDWDNSKNNCNNSTSNYYNVKMERTSIDYLEEDDAYEYFFDMIFAQQYAVMNRKLMLVNVLYACNIEYDHNQVIQSIHNYIDFQHMIIRKGAISANFGEKCIISLNMRDGILFGVGKGNERWNYSCAHGCGRQIVRSQVKNKITLKQYKESMKDVYSTSVSMDTIDEAPIAYKPTELIKVAIQPTVDVYEHLKPVINVKGSS